MALCPGRIVYPIDPICDPQGGNPKAERPFIVVSSRDEIAKGNPLKLIGITGAICSDADEVTLSDAWNSKNGLSKNRWHSAAGLQQYSRTG